MAISWGKERWVADWVAPSSRQKDGTWIFHRVTARVTRAAHAGAQHARMAQRRNWRTGCPAVDRRAGRGGIAAGGAATTDTANVVVTGRPTVRTAGTGAQGNKSSCSG